MIIIYTSPTCTSCKVIEEYLKEKNIPFLEADAREKAEELIQQGFTSVPILEIHGQRFFVPNLISLKFLLKQLGIEGKGNGENL